MKAIEITREELQAIKSSFNKLRGNLERHSLYFYNALFRRDPELRSMFREDIEGQGMKFMRTLGIIIDRLGDDVSTVGEFSDLGGKHASLGVTAAQYGLMEEALIDTLRHAQGDEFTAQLEESWRKAYKKVSQRMMERGGIEPH